MSDDTDTWPEVIALFFKEYKLLVYVFFVVVVIGTGLINHDHIPVLQDFVHAIADLAKSVFGGAA